MTRETFWYLGDFDSRTNEIISTIISDECRSAQVLCQDGKKRDLWQTDYTTIMRLKNSRLQQNLTFTVFKRDGKFGPVKKYDFPKRTTAAERKVKNFLMEKELKEKKKKEKRLQTSQQKIDEKISHHKK